MLTAIDIIKQIKTLTIDVIGSGLCNSQNFPSLTYESNNISNVGISVKNNSIYLKNISYMELYSELIKRKQYNLRMIDGALISLLYRFQKDTLIAHRLSFFPSPNLEEFQNEPEMYLNDEIYLDSLNIKTVAVPLRFDFDAGEAFIPIEHPKSHLTIGQYENCRIPVSSALSPYQFLNFIMRHFYHTPKNKKHCILTEYLEKFSSSITENEQKMIHVCI